MSWGYEFAKEEFGASEIGGDPWYRMTNPKTGGEIIIKDVEGANTAKTVTYDPKRLMDGATKLSSFGFGDALIAKM